MNKETTAAITTIGDEILAGDVPNSNASWLAQELQSLGIYVKLMITLPDEIRVISSYIRLIKNRYDFIFITGGVGPTPDDVTRESIAQALNLRLRMNSKTEHLIRETCGDTCEHKLSMAHLPEGAEHIDNPSGYFPAFVIENLYVFPGVPSMMKTIFGAIRSQLKTSPIMKVSFTTSRKESEYAEFMTQAMKMFPGVSIGSYPHFSDDTYFADIVLRSKDIKEMEKARKWLETRIN